MWQEALRTVDTPLNPVEKIAVTQPTSTPLEDQAEPLRALFCVNWAVDRVVAADGVRFSPDYRIDGQPYWFFKHGEYNIDVDVLDCRSFLGVHRLERKFLRCYPSKSTLAWIRSRRYDVVMSHGGQVGLVLALLQTLLGERLSPPHVMFDVGAISGGSQRWNNSAVINVFSFALKSLAGVICHSSHQLDFYRKQYPGLSEIARFIPLGVDTDAFQPQDTPEQDEIICVGYAFRDWKLLVRAYARLNTSTRLVLLGIPASECVSSPGVECVPRVNIDEMKRRISRSRFVVLPIPQLEFCTGQQTFLQSMALGKTVLISDIPAVRDYIVDSDTGFLYRPGDEDDLYQKLKLLLSADGTVKSVGTAARNAVVTQFSESLMADRVVTLLRDVVRHSQSETRTSRPRHAIGYRQADETASEHPSSSKSSSSKS
jgi:glycosyltransferase involved in cell wall biosynthesis